jgi:hypothetical protein
MNRHGRGMIRVLGLIVGVFAMLLPAWGVRAGKSAPRIVHPETSLNLPTVAASSGEPRRFDTFSYVGCGVNRRHQHREHLMAWTT